MRYNTDEAHSITDVLNIVIDIPITTAGAVNPNTNASNTMHIADNTLFNSSLIIIRIYLVVD